MSTAKRMILSAIVAMSLMASTAGTASAQYQVFCYEQITVDGQTYWLSVC